LRKEGDEGIERGERRFEVEAVHWTRSADEGCGRLGANAPPEGCQEEGVGPGVEDVVAVCSSSDELYRLELLPLFERRKSPSLLDIREKH
jgi:hypothetical protein